ncbi:hypothetical protein [Panacagrimonas sp.]|uniref:hypothetical protein n=1 Tax=Panacagrimonas sp. TaxID=2480088 RepID=UPI003B517B6C
MATCFCTLAIHPPYRQRARLLCADTGSIPWVVLTDEPADFDELPQVQAVRHVPTGPMAIDYLARMPDIRGRKGSAAYHDKRHVLAYSLERFDTAIFFDADTRLRELPALPTFPPGLSVLPVIRHSVDQHLSKWGAWRRPAFEDLARELAGDPAVLARAPWCLESAMAITRDTRQAQFFDYWGRAADYLQSREMYSGEGGVIGLAAYLAGWSVDYRAWAPLASCISHEGRGPKGAS